ncbi:MAG: anti-sigma F factor [Lachnospiraceae bacterium]
MDKVNNKEYGSRNEMELVFDALSANEGFARVAVAAFIADLNPTLEEISDVKTAVSEAVTNCIIHGYEGKPGKIWIRCMIERDLLHIEIEDKGAGIADVARAMEPLFTTRPELDRSGMGFSFMEAFMDDLEVESVPAQGTVVRMKKKLGCEPLIEQEE